MTVSAAATESGQRRANHDHKGDPGGGVGVDRDAGTNHTRATTRAAVHATAHDRCGEATTRNGSPTAKRKT